MQREGKNRGAHQVKEAGTKIFQLITECQSVESKRKLLNKANAAMPI